MYLRNVANAHLETQRWADAEKASRECLRLYAEKKSEDWTHFSAKSQLGAALAGQKKYAEAEPLLIAGYEGMKARERKIPATSKKELAAAAARIVPLYESWGKADEAAVWRPKLGGPSGK